MYLRVAPGQAFSLGQDLDSDRASLSGEQYLHKMINNCRPLWLSHHEPQQVATPQKVFQSQCLYTWPWLTCAVYDGVDDVPLCSRSDVADVPGRRGNALWNQAGNAMNAHVIGCLILWLAFALPPGEEL